MPLGQKDDINEVQIDNLGTKPIWDCFFNIILKMVLSSRVPCLCSHYSTLSHVYVSTCEMFFHTQMRIRMIFYLNSSRNTFLDCTPVYCSDSPILSNYHSLSQKIGLKGNSINFLAIEFHCCTYIRKFIEPHEKSWFFLPIIAKHTFTNIFVCLTWKF